MSDKLYDLSKLVETVDGWSKRHRISRDAANEMGIALERVCHRYEAELSTLRARIAELEGLLPGTEVMAAIESVAHNNKIMGERAFAVRQWLVLFDGIQRRKEGSNNE